jgi:S-adenosylmethionine decarboxylase proenzyme
MPVLGYHYLIECYGCSSDLLSDVEFLKKTLYNALQTAGAVIIGNIFHEFSPHGVSGVYLIKESHFSIHSWPEYGYAAVDFFTCNEKLNIQDAYRQLVTVLNANRSDITEIKRGLIEDI